MKRAEGFVALGKIVRAHGVRGELQVYPYTEEQDALARYESVYVAGPGGELETLAVRGVRTKGRWALLSLEGVSGRDEAEALVGCEILQTRTSLPAAGEGEYYWHDLIGLEVVTTGGLHLGTVRRIIATGAHDVYVVKGGGGEVLLPAVEEVIREVDTSRGVMLVEPPPGLIEANAL